MVSKFAPGMVAIAMLMAHTGGAAAQTVGPDEASTADGAIFPQLALTRDQETAIYNAVINERVKPPAAQVAPAVGAPVPQQVNLPDLPGQDNFAIEGAGVLKYAMLGGEVMVIDPVLMRVVAIIHDRPQK
jgi:hypothetical protein